MCDGDSGVSVVGGSGASNANDSGVSDGGNSGVSVHCDGGVSDGGVNGAGLFVPAALTLAVCFCGRNRTLIVAILTVAVGFTGFTMAGYSVNHLDIAPQYAGFIGPAIVGFLTNGNDTIHQWNIFFYLSAAIFFVGGFVFAVFAEGEPQGLKHTILEEDTQSASTPSESKDEPLEKSLRFPGNYHTLPGNLSTRIGNIQSSPSEFVYDVVETAETRSEHRKTNTPSYSDS
ncbi:sialin [Elysia marginata]|uniref:Sialin n=1 Tax=Elysia marginata TaxID=1093978 RepID=A0AAV4FCN1_9GAST|nr:sialin [Elysia marginata]